MASLTLVIPEFFITPSAEQHPTAKANSPDLPSLKLFKARAKTQALTGVDPYSKEALAFYLFNREPNNGAGTLPIAPITHLIDFDMGHDGHWIRADPVYLRPDLHDLKLFDASSLSLARSEAEQLVSEINATIGSQEWRLVLGNNTKRWYLKLNGLPKITTYSPRQVMGKDVDSHLPRGAEAAQWHRLANEIQMLLHGSEINAAREQRGEPPVNSVWFWGAGQLPDKTAPAWQGVWSDDANTQGLAVLGGIPHAEVPRNAHQWYEAKGQMELSLIDLDTDSRYEGLTDPTDSMDFYGWLETSWFTPLLSLVKDRKLDILTVVTNNETMTLTRRLLKRFWIRPPPKSTLERR